MRSAVSFLVSNQTACHCLYDSSFPEGGVKLWRTWHRWIQPDGTLYTSEQATSHTMSKLLKFLSSSQIVSVSPATKGTQLKVIFLLEGGQRAIFRPMRYPRDHVIEEGGNKGADRHNGEIAAFHLARILGSYLTNCIAI